MIKLIDSPAYSAITSKWSLPENHKVTAGQVAGN